jgi:hypothetical protein
VVSAPFRRFDDYDFRHFVAMRAAALAMDDVHRLFALQDDGRNAWFAARDSRSELAGYLDDLNIATGIADAAASQSRTRAYGVGMQARYALIAAILRDTARNLPSSLSVALLRSAVWTREQALAWTDLQPDREAALTAVVEALADADARQEDLGVLAVTTAAAIGSSDNKTLAVATLASRLPVHQQWRALDVIAREENEGSRLGGLRSIAQHLPPPLRSEAAKIAREFRQVELRAEALAAVAEAHEEPERGHLYAEALAAAEDALDAPETDSVENRGASTLARLAESLPEDLLSRVLEAANASTTMRAYDRQRVVAAVLARLASERPDWAYQQTLKLDPSVDRDQALARIAQALAQAGRATDALEVWDDIEWVATAAAVAGSLAPNLPPGHLVQLAARTARLEPYYRIEALGAMARVPGAPADALRAAAEEMSDDDRRRALAAILPAVDTTAVDEILGPAPDLQGMEHTAPYLSRQQTLRVLNAARGRSLSGLDYDRLGALLVRLAQLGDPDEALMRVGELQHVSGYDRRKLLAAVVPELPPALLPHARKLVQPDAEPVARLLARAHLLASLPAARREQIATQAEQLPAALDRVRVLTAIVPLLSAEQRTRAGTALLNALEASIEHPSLDRRALHQAAWRCLSEAPPAAALAAASALEDLDDRFAALLALAPTVPAAATLIVEMTVGHPKAVAYLISTRPSADVRRHITNAIGAIDDDTTMAAAVAALGDVVLRDDAPVLVARLARISDPAVRLPALFSLVGSMKPSMRRQVARNELAQWDDGRSSWITVVSVCVIARCHRPAATAVIPAAVAAIARFSVSREKARAAILLADALDLPIDRELQEELLTGSAIDDELLLPLIAHLDDDGVRRLRARVTDLVPRFREHEVVAELARRALALGDHGLALDCLTCGQVYRIEDAVTSVAKDLPLDLIDVAANVAGDDRDALAALARRAAELGDGHTAVLLTMRGGNHGLGTRLAELATLVPDKTVPTLVALAKGVGYGAAWPLAALVPRVPRSERRVLVCRAVVEAGELRLAMAAERVSLLHKLATELARLPVADVVELWGEAVRRSAELGREEVLCDISGFAPALVRRFGPKVALALDDAIRVAACDHWP